MTLTVVGIGADGWSGLGAAARAALGATAEIVARSLQPGRRIVAYVTGADGAARLARVLCEGGFGASAFTVLQELGGPLEQRLDMTAQDAIDHTADPLHVVALTVSGGPSFARTPGLADEAFAGDGQLTKRHVRAVTVAALAPMPGELLWDVGAGSGSVGIEWLRAEASASAVAIEPRAARAERIAANALRLGVPELRVVEGRAPEALRELPAPAAVFVGGGITTPGLLDACWDALSDGGRLVANTVTLEGEQVIAAARRDRGGSLTRIDIAQAEPLGSFSGWRAQLTVVQWAATKGRGTRP